MADGVVTVLGAVKRQQREVGTPTQESLALKVALAQALAEVETLAREAAGDASGGRLPSARLPVPDPLHPAGNDHAVADHTTSVILPEPSDG
jgi:hypothetical protein